MASRSGWAQTVQVRAMANGPLSGPQAQAGPYYEPWNPSSTPEGVKEP